MECNNVLIHLRIHLNGRPASSKMLVRPKFLMTPMMWGRRIFLSTDPELTYRDYNIDCLLHQSEVSTVASKMISDRDI